MHRKFGSRNIIDILSNLGCCASYHEVNLYEASILSQKIIPNTFHQFVFDNADFNINNIDSLNTFHSMGGIHCVTPFSAVSSEQLIVRLKSTTLEKDIIKITILK